MELLPGINLRQRIQQDGHLACDRALSIVRGVGAALTVAHQRGLVHRDLKPENIFLVEDRGRDLPKVLDFGLAKFVGEQQADTRAATVDTGAGVLVGTPQYMSPEQLKGKPVAPGWDLWAMTIILYEMLTGAYPFGRHESVAALHDAILAARFAPVDRHLPQAPLRWQEFFAHNLAADARRRATSAAEFLSSCEQTFGLEAAHAARIH